MYVVAVKFGEKKTTRPIVVLVVGGIACTRVLLDELNDKRTVQMHALKSGSEGSRRAARRSAFAKCAYPSDLVCRRTKAGKPR